MYATHYECTPDEYAMILQASAQVWSNTPRAGCRWWATIEELISETFNRWAS